MKGTNQVSLRPTTDTRRCNTCLWGIKLNVTQPLVLDRTQGMDMLDKNSGVYTCFRMPNPSGPFPGAHYCGLWEAEI